MQEKEVQESDDDGGCGGVLRASMLLASITDRMPLPENVPEGIAFLKGCGDDEALPG